MLTHVKKYVLKNNSDVSITASERITEQTNQEASA
jgi:hypothetical protein